MTNDISNSLTELTFQLTSSRRGWPLGINKMLKRDTFQLTSSRRGWPWFDAFSKPHLYFNSHPHEEDDVVRSDLHSIDVIFQLTSSRRGWRHWNHDYLPPNISTHILTKRMTKVFRLCKARTVFQLTSSRRGWQNLLRSLHVYRHFNSHPHEEDDI